MEENRVSFESWFNLIKHACNGNNRFAVLLRPILDAALKQGMLRLFQHGLVWLGTPVLDEEKMAVLKQLYW